jgi:hypothetical protein
MRAPQACLALLFTAAVLLQGTAADNKCDPSSANCQGAFTCSVRLLQQRFELSMVVSQFWQLHSQLSAWSLGTPLQHTDAFVTLFKELFSVQQVAILEHTSLHTAVPYLLQVQSRRAVARQA